MAGLSRQVLSRRSILRGGTVMSAILFGGLAAVLRTGDPLALPPAAAATEQARPSDAYTDINGIWAEYREAIVDYPLPEPQGWSFPPHSALRDSAPGNLWERGHGRAEAYLNWQRASVEAAFAAWSRGDSAEANRILDQLQIGYESPTRRAYVDDPDNWFIHEGIRLARSSSTEAGDFVPLMRMVGS